MAGTRTMVFVDAQNLVRGAKQFGGGSFDYDVNSLVDELVGDREFVRGYWFDSHEPGNRGEKESFYAFLETNGFRVESSALNRDGDGFKEKEADIRLATELIATGFVDGYDTAVVVTGDRDFVSAIRHVQDQGKVVEVAAFEGPMSDALRRAADDYTHLDDVAETIRRDERRF
jgi:uncharacterized LabA/DUF88 family protein